MKKLLTIITCLLRGHERKRELVSWGRYDWDGFKQPGVVSLFITKCERCGRELGRDCEDGLFKKEK